VPLFHLVELLRQFFWGTVAALILQKLPRPPTLCFHDLDSLGAGFPVMHIPNRVSLSFYTCGPTNCLDRVLLSELIKSGGTGAPPLLGFNNLFLNQPLLWHNLPDPISDKKMLISPRDLLGF